MTSTKKPKTKHELNYLIEKLRTLLPIVEKKFQVKRLEVFGSYIHSEQHKDSDLDLLVEFHETIDLFEYIELEDFLTEQLKVKVDLVMKEALKPRIKNQILNEAIPI